MGSKTAEIMQPTVQAKATSSHRPVIDSGGDGSACKPLLTDEELVLLQSWGQQRNGKFSPGVEASSASSLAKGITAATAGISFRDAYQWPNMPLAALGSTSTTKTTDATPTILSSTATLSRGCRTTRGIKRFTFVPMSAWLNDMSEEEGGNDKQKVRKDETPMLPNDEALCHKEPKLKRRASSASATSRGLHPTNSDVVYMDRKNLDAEEVSVSISIIEQSFSMDTQSESSNSVSMVKSRKPSPPISSSQTSDTLTPMPTPPLPPRLLPPPLPQPSPPPRPFPRTRPRTNPSCHGQMIGRPSEVAAMLHELLRNASGIAPAASSTASAPNATSSAVSCVGVAPTVRSFGTKGRNDSKGKNKTKLTTSSTAPVRLNSSHDVSILHSLARIIAERISGGTRNHRDKKSKGGKVESLDQLYVNRALLATEENTRRIAIKSKKQKKSEGRRSMSRNEFNDSNASLCGFTHACLRRQQNCNNCNNCYETPVKNGKFLCHNHFSNVVHSRASQSASNFSLSSTTKVEVPEHGFRATQAGGISNLGGFERLVSKLRASKEQYDQLNRRDRHASDSSCQPYVPTTVVCNGSNACHCRRSTKLFYQLDEVAANEPSQKILESHDRTDQTMTSCRDKQTEWSPECSPPASFRSRFHSSFCHDLVSNIDGAGASTMCKPLEHINTTSDSYSTEDACLTQPNSLLSSVQVACHPKLDIVDQCGTADCASGISSSTRQSREIASESPTFTDDKLYLGQSVVKESRYGQRHEQQPRYNIGEIRRARPRATDVANATSAAEFAHQLFKSLVRNRDESAFVHIMEDPPREMSLRAVLSNAIAGSDPRNLLKRSSVRVLVPESLLKSKGKERFDSARGAQGSSDVHSIVINDISKQECTPTPSIHTYASVCSTQPAEALPMPIHEVVDLPTDGDPQCTTSCGASVDRTAAKTISKRLSQALRARRLTSGQAGRRRSRVHVVEPLTDSILHYIEFPACLVRRPFLSWRPAQFTQLCLYIVPVDSLESTLESFNQPASLFCHSSGSVITADSRMTIVMTSNLCYGTENIIYRFARRVVSRIINGMSLTSPLANSPKEIVKLLNNATRGIERTSASPDNKSCSRLSWRKLLSDAGQFRPSGLPRESSSGTQSVIECQLCSERGVNQDLELVRVASNLAVQFRGPNERKYSNHHRQKYSRRLTTTDSAESSLEFTRDSVLANVEADTHQLRLKHVSLLRNHSPVTADLTSVSNGLIQLGPEDYTRGTVTRCTELTTNVNLVLVSIVSDQLCDYDWQEQSGCTLDTLTSDVRSGESPGASVDMRSLSDQVTVLKERMAEATDEIVFDSDEPYPLSTYDRFRDRLHAEREMVMEQLEGRWHGRAIDTHSATGASPEPRRHQVFARDASSHGSLQSRSGEPHERRSYNSHSFTSRSTAILPGVERGGENVLLNITCQLTVVDKADMNRSKSSSPDESSGSETSELVCA